MADQTETREPESLEIVEVVDGSVAIAALNRSEIDVQIATAKRYPRDIRKFRTDAMTLATLDEETAAACFYVLDRDGKSIEGPSARLAEIVCMAWRNIRSGGRIVAIDDKHVTAQGACFDLEANNAATIEVKRRITGRSGRRYSEDMITVTAQAAIAIAVRNAVFKVVPFALVKEVYEAARAASIGKAKPIKERRAGAMAAFGKMGVKPEQVLLIAKATTADDLDDDALIRLRGIFTAIKDGDTTLDEVMRNAQGAPVVVTPDSLGGVKAADVVAGATSAEEETTPTGGAPSAESGQLSIGAPTSAPAEPDIVKMRLDEIKREAEVKGLKQGVLDSFYRKHLSSANPAEWPASTETWARLGKVLQEIRGIRVGK